MHLAQEETARQDELCKQQLNRRLSQIEQYEAVIAEAGEEIAFADAKVDFLDGVTVEYPEWWFNVRKSNTEPLLRLCLEGTTQAAFDAGRARVLPLLGTPVDR